MELFCSTWAVGDHDLIWLKNDGIIAQSITLFIFIKLGVPDMLSSCESNWEILRWTKAE